MGKMESRSKGIFKIILIILLFMFLVANIYLYNLTKIMKKENKEVKANLSVLNNNIDDIIKTNEQINSDIAYLEEITTNIINKKKEYFNNIKVLEQKILKKESNVKIAYLTFDDGPYKLTEKYLKVLRDNDVRATFFVLGRPYRASYYQKIINDGHTIANHTYSHKIRNGIYRSSDTFIKDVVKLENYLSNNFGVTTNIVRFPGGSSQARGLKKTIVNKLHDMEYGYVDWTAETGDGSNLKMRQMGAYECFVKTLNNRKIAVVLMHDYNRSTLANLPKIIKYLKDHGYVMFPLFKDSVIIK